jgi:hypothetical protein
MISYTAKNPILYPIVFNSELASHLASTSYCRSTLPLRVNISPHVNSLFHVSSATARQPAMNRTSSHIEQPINAKYDTFQYFPFFDLPIELRLMVYEFLPNRTKRAEFVRLQGDVVTSAFTLITTLTSTAILASCRLIRKEAMAIVNATAKRYSDATDLNGPAVRIEDDSLALEALKGKNGLILEVDAQYRFMLRKEHGRGETPQLKDQSSLY